MSDPVRVEIVPRRLPADPSVIEAAERNLAAAHTTGSEPEIRDAIEALAAAQQPSFGWSARVNGTEFPVVDFASSPADGGRTLLNLVVAVDSVNIGGPSTGRPAPEVRPATPEQKNQRAVWGEPGRPDPRENIPGWVPADTSDLVRLRDEGTVIA